MPKLKPYQTEAVEYARGRDHVLIRDQMGLGKTIEALAILKDQGIRRFLVICPASVQDKWRREIRTWYPKSSSQVLSWAHPLLDTVATDWKPECVILDEVHYMKNPDSKRTNKAVQVIMNAPKTIALSGTFPPNYPNEIWAYLNAIGHPFGGFLYETFIDYWCTSFLKKFHPRQQKKTRVITGIRNPVEFQEFMESLSIRRTMDEVLPQLGTPELNLVVINEAEDTKEYLELERIFHKHSRREQTEIPMASIRHEMARLKYSYTVKQMKEALKHHEKIVVFAHHRQLIGDLAAKFDGVCITGETPAVKRQQLIDQFQQDSACRVFVGQIQAAGIGVDLVAASYLLFAECSWVPGENEQCIGRLHRIGQANGVKVDFLCFEDSIDIKVLKTAMRKAHDLNPTKTTEDELWV